MYWWTGRPAAAAKSLQSCPTLCDPIDGSPPGSSVPGILQARILEWVAISFSNAWKWKVKVKSLSRARFLATPWTAAYQAPPSMGFSGKSTGVGCQMSTIAGSCSKSGFSFIRSHQPVIRVAVPFAFPTVKEGSICSTSSPAFGGVSFLDFGCSKYVVASHWF